MIKVRASSIKIEVPKERAEPWVSVMVQRVEQNGSIINTIDNYDRFNKRMTGVESDTYQSGAVSSTADGKFAFSDVATMLNIVVINWLAERYNGSIDTEGNVVIEG